MVVKIRKSTRKSTGKAKSKKRKQKNKFVSFGIRKGKTVKGFDR